jgi:xanthine dehydrogenase YagR molybdenum-binding subunit
VADYSWPSPSSRSLLGKRISRIDGPAKVSGAARYAYDVHRPGMLFAKVLRCPHAHARITRIDVAPAERMPGVKAVHVLQGKGAEIRWAHDEIAAVAATTEGAAEDALRSIVVEYEVLPHSVDDARRPSGPPSVQESEGDPERAMAAADVKVEGTYGLPVIAHCCLESHGQVSDWESKTKLTAWCSTQNVSGMPGQLAEGLGVAAADVRVVCDYIGGGFGSKFGPDRWGIACAELARKAGAPVHLMLDREAELAVAGDRPSAYAWVRVGAKKDGTLTAWESRSWGSGGLGGSGSPPLPYVLEPPNRKHEHVSVPTNKGGSRAWRAPNHPQACLITMAAFDDLAAKLAMDPLALLKKNLSLAGAREGVYAEELAIGAELIGWQKRWHPRGTPGPGPVRRGLGVSLHTWGGRGHRSTCEVVVQPDGGVEARLGSQDLGTGTRTIIGMVLAETLGLPLEAVRVEIGDSRYPASGGSGGSTTVGGVSAATRRAATNALQEIFEKVAPELSASTADLEAVGGAIRVKGNPSRSIPWKRAASRIGPSPLSVRGENPGPGRLIDSGVGGIQMADVSVDVETGIVRIERMVAVQDCGLILDLKTAESQVLGALIMGISYALSEEKIHDPVTGRLLNGNMEFYKLPGIADVGELVVRMMTGPGYDERGVIGLGEPPVISPGAAISNAVANAIGVRVPNLPLTPDRVLAALGKDRVS